MSFNEIFYHIVMRIEKSGSILHPITAKLVETKIEEILSASGGDALAIKLLSDHLHLLFMGLPALSIDDIVFKLKGGTTEFVEGTGRGEVLHWAENYGVVSVSKSHIDILKNYIETQEERHKTAKLNATLEKFE